MSTSDGFTLKSNDCACEMNDMLQNMSMVDNEVNDTSVCANCGKEDAKNICNKCKQVKYCNAVCKKVHKKKHKKECEEHIRLATEKHDEELRLVAELHDEKLFKQPPSQLGDCPICFILLPVKASGSTYYACCGKEICTGCVLAPVYDDQGNEVVERKCPFCRSSKPTSEENTKSLKKRAEKDDPIAIYNVGVYYRDGDYGFPQDYNKALELFHRAGVLGHAKSYCNIGYAYDHGQGLKIDKKKANHYYELAAMDGDVAARYNLGIIEEHVGNKYRALKHYIIAARGGNSESLEAVKDLYSMGHATKEDYAKTLQLYQAYLGEIKSPQRDKAAAANQRYRYY